MTSNSKYLIAALALAASNLSFAGTGIDAGQPTAQVQDQARTRAQVRAELAEAQRTGDIVYGPNGEKLNEIYPERYPVQSAAPARSRAEVRQELLQAKHHGDMPSGETA
jgi:hypothetical protein